MLKSNRMILAMACLVALAVRASAEDEPKAILTAALKAHGGKDRLVKFSATQTKAKGTLELLGMSLPFTQESSVMFPNKIKEGLELEVGGKKITVLTVYNGEKGWIQTNGETKEMDDKILGAMKDAVLGIQILRMAYLQDKKCEFSSLGEIKVNDKPAVGVKVSAKGYKDVNLFFDKKTNLLAKIEHQTMDVMADKEITEERIFVEYQEIDGIKVAKKVVINREGKKFMDLEVTEVKSLEKLDDSEFGKP